MFDLGNDPRVMPHFMFGVVTVTIAGACEHTTCRELFFAVPPRLRVVGVGPFVHIGGGRHGRATRLPR